MKVLRTILAVNLFLAGAAGGAFAQNYKIKQVTTMNGQKTESTVYVKGSRKRTEGVGFMGMGGNVADVEQCDLKRSLKISDKKRMYAIELFDDDAGTTTAPTTKMPKSKIEKGGTVTYTSNITDTGERKQMFGLTARHVKPTMTMQGSPDACMNDSMEMETDGWYVDVPQFSCPMTARPQMPQMGGGGCRDKMIFKTSGGGKLGFPLTETRTMKMGDDEDDPTFSQTLETLEFSKATLDAALFDIPTGYTLTGDAQSLYGKPDMSTMTRTMGGDDDEDEDKPRNKPSNNQTSSMNNSSNKTPTDKKAGMVRIGVCVPTNKAGENISTTNMQTFLIQKLTGKSRGNRRQFRSGRAGGKLRLHFDERFFQIKAVSREQNRRNVRQNYEHRRFFRAELRRAN